MKKNIELITVLSLLLFSGRSQAQLANGSIAPDWTFTDINGVSHHLYDDLAAGKTVFLDLSTTWCSGCWIYHNYPNLESLWQNHGPAGGAGVISSTTNDVMVYLIECDGYTSSADLHGTGTNTLGDWVTGTNYPIIDPPNPDIGIFNTNYGNCSYLTMYMICPDGSITYYGNSPPNDLYAAKLSCDPPTPGWDAKMKLSSLNPILESCDSVNPQFTISNVGTNTLTSATITYKVDGLIQKVFFWTGSLATYSDALISTIKLGSAISGSHSISAEVSNPNGVIDPTISNNISFTTFNIYSSIGPLVSESFESSGIPTSWTIGNGGHAPTWSTASTGYSSSKSASLNWFDSIRTPGEIDIFTLEGQSFVNATTATLNFDVAYCGDWSIDGNSELQVEVSVNCGATWESKYSKSGSTLSTNPDHGYPFVPSTTADWRQETVNLSSLAGQAKVLIRFKGTSAYSNNLYIDNISITTVTGIEESVIKNNISVYPNPVASFTTVDFDLLEASNVSILLLNQFGQVLRNENLGRLSSGEQQYLLNIKTIPNGIYFLNIKAGQRIITEKLTVTNN